MGWFNHQLLVEHVSNVFPFIFTPGNTSQADLQVLSCPRLPSLKLTAKAPEQWMVGILSRFLLGLIFGRPIFRCKPTNSLASFQGPGLVTPHATMSGTFVLGLANSISTGLGWTCLASPEIRFFFPTVLRCVLEVHGPWEF